MRIRIATLAFLLGSLVAYDFYTSPPSHKVKGPTTHYHGYVLNKAAIHRAKLITVLISAEGFGGAERGTGVLLDRRHVLTCAHVAVNDADETHVYFYPGYILAKAKPVFVNRHDDLAILELDVPVKAPYYAKFQTAHYDGEPITIIGNILGSMKWFVSYGIISGENERDLYTDGLVRGGNSGGPWINEAGEIVALTDWGLEDRSGKDEGISGGVSAATIQRFLKAWKHPTFMDLLGAM